MSEGTDSARIDALASRVEGLEGRMLGAEDSSTADFEHTIEPGVAVQQTSDPKGRKPWEAEWSQEHGVLKVFIPDNAVVVDGQNVEVYSDDKDGSECTVTAGSWYLHVYKSDDGTYEAEFDQESTGSRPGLNDSTESAKYDLKILDVSQDGGYVEKQYVVGSIVLGKGGVTSLKGDDENSVKILGDVELDGSKGGLTIKTELEEQDGGGKPKAKVSIDIKGREAADCPSTYEWGCKRITLPDNTFAHILACSDIDLSDLPTSSGGGGGGGGSVSVSAEWLKKNGVTSLNALKGDVWIGGGKGIDVSVDKERNEIKIAYNPDKEDEDEPPEPEQEQEEQGCPHPGGAGGVQGDTGGGGVPAGGGDYHVGDDSCC